jgi:hypothetical protein
MKTFFSMVFAGMISTAVAQVDTAENVARSTVRGTEKAARTVAHGVEKAADTVEDAFTPDTDARRVDVTVTDERIDMPAQLKPGKTAFVVKNAGKTTQNFEVEGRGVHRKFVAAPNPAKPRSAHDSQARHLYRLFAWKKTRISETAPVTLSVQ